MTSGIHGQPYNLRIPFQPPTDADLADPLSLLAWYQKTIRLYVHNRINWMDIRETLRIVEEKLAEFHAR